jgi:hypothetical protein
VAGASIGVPVALKALPRSVECETCSVPGRFSAHTFSDATGAFKLTGVPNGVPFTLSIQKGHFRRVIKVTVPACGHLDLTRDLTTLPGKNRQWDPLDEVPSIAVVSGAWDHLEKVLDKLGVQEKKVYNGKDYGTGPDSIQALLQDNIRLRSHHLLLINCGTKFDALAAEAAPRNNLREYLRRGGRLFVTDRSYDFAEQAFPEFIDFERSDGTPADQPEELDAAEVGSDLPGQIPGAILDPALKAWLALPEINALQSGVVSITSLEAPWAVQKSVNSAVGGKVWVNGPVTWAGGQGVRPLTSSCDYRGKDGSGCGRVVFSSYHTYGDAPDLLPQERILEYLILEVGNCMDIEQL